MAVEDPHLQPGWRVFCLQAHARPCSSDCILLMLMLVVAAMLCAFFCCAESSYDGEEEGQGEFESFVEPAGLILSSFIEKNLMTHGGKTELCVLQPVLPPTYLQGHLPALHHRGAVHCSHALFLCKMQARRGLHLVFDMFNLLVAETLHVFIPKT